MRREVWKALRPLAQGMRSEPTPAERAMWELLRDRRLAGLKFRRQHSIGPFVLDFYCSRARLVIEIDGPIHQFSKEADSARQKFLEARGLRVIRFSNEEILGDTAAVREKICSAVARWVSPSPVAGEGGGG